MAAETRCSAPAAGGEEDFEIIDKKQLPEVAELRSEGKAKAEEARWSGPILSLARKASENLALGYGSALRSAGLAGLAAKPGSDSAAKTTPLGCTEGSLNSMFSLMCWLREGTRCTFAIRDKQTKRGQELQT